MASRNFFALFLAASVLLSLISLSGCLGSPGLGSCASLVNESDQEQCVYYNAVLDQIPSRCYDVRNMTLREVCLRESNDPLASQRLMDAAAQEQMIQASAQEALPLVPAPVPKADPISLCMETQHISREGCMRSVAIETGNISLCGEIQSGDYRASCISNLAITYHNMADCNLLKNSADVEICKKYVQNG